MNWRMVILFLTALGAILELVLEVLGEKRNV